MLIHEYLFKRKILYDPAVLIDYSFLDNIVDIEQVVRNSMSFYVNKTLRFIIKHTSVYYIASFDNVISHRARA